MVTAELLSIGDEILIGQTVNTNAAWLGEHLNAIGLEITRTTVLQDKREEIILGLNEASQRAEVIIMTGGLGPTRDDITKHTLCEYFQTSLVRDAETLDRIERYFVSRGREILEINRQQADIPAACVPIRNNNGTAPGMWFEKDGKVYLSLPGVPYEMQAMMEETVIEKLTHHFSLPTIAHKTIMTQGIGESFLAEQIKDWEDKVYAEGMSIAYLPSPGLVRLRITSKGQPNPWPKMEELAREIEARFPQYVYGYDGDSLEEIIGKMLQEKRATLGAAESCTGGFFAHRITSVAGSSAYFKGTLVAYDNSIKVKCLGVNPIDIETHGAVSETVVRQMAAGAKELLNVDFAVATSGIAGPTGGTDEKPLGLAWIAVATPQRIISTRFIFGNKRDRNITQATLSGLNMLRIAISE